MSRILSKEEINGILSKMTMEKAFRFQRAEGQDTHVAAVGLVDFAEKLIKIDVTSIDFLYPRGDFQKWVSEVVKDNELSDRLCYIKKEDSGEKLRKDILKIVQNRILELKNNGLKET